MTASEHRRVHWSFWVIGTVALLWNLMGAINFLVQLNPGTLEAYRESEQAIIADRPLWATAGFALAVFGGTIGAMLLLLRKSLAVPVFAASFLGVVVAVAHSLSLGIGFGAGEVIGIVAMPLAVAGFLIWYARHAQRNGWTT